MAPARATPTYPLDMSRPNSHDDVPTAARIDREAIAIRLNSSGPTDRCLRW